MQKYGLSREEAKAVQEILIQQEKEDDAREEERERVLQQRLADSALKYKPPTQCKKKLAKWESWTLGSSGSSGSSMSSGCSGSSSGSSGSSYGSGNIFLARLMPWPFLFVK